MAESEWILRAKQGDEEAFAFLVNKYNYLIKSTIAFYMNKRMVEDVSQEIWVQIYKKLWQLEDPQKFVPWARKLTYYHCVNTRRKTNTINNFELKLSAEGWVHLSESISGEHFTIHDWMIKKEAKKEFRRLLTALPGDYEIMIRLRYLHELSYGEIHELTNLPLSTIKWRIHQGKKLFKAILIKSLKRKGVY